MKGWVILLVCDPHVPEAPHPPLVEWKKLPYGEMVPGQASGTCMLQDSTRRAKVMGLIMSKIYAIPALQRTQKGRLN